MYNLENMLDQAELARVDVMRAEDAARKLAFELGQTIRRNQLDVDTVCGTYDVNKSDVWAGYDEEMSDEIGDF